MKALFPLLAFISAAISCYGQSKDTLGYSKLADAIFFSNKKEVSYSNVYFVNDLPDKGSESFLSNYFFPIEAVTIFGGFKKYLELKGTLKDSSGYYHSKCKSINIDNCTFEGDLRFSNVIFDGTFSMRNNEFPVVSEDFVGLYGQKFGGAILIDSCKFNQYIQILFRKDHEYRFFAKFNHSSFNSFNVELQNSTTQILNSLFKNLFRLQLHKESRISIDSTEFLNLQNDESLNMEFDDISSVSITNSKFTDTSNDFCRLNLNCKRINLENNEFNVNTDLSFSESNLFVNNNKFLKYLTLDFNSIDRNSYLSLESLKNLNFGIFQGDYYDATTVDQINNDIALKHYLRLNKNLYDFFKETGDLSSANQTYVRIKEIESTKLKFLFYSKPNFKNLFSLKLNQLLKFYTNYGTDPARAIVISIYIILFFGIFYFFFPSDWDITSKARLIRNFKDFTKKNKKGRGKSFIKLLKAFTISILNAVTLSLNAFTTLGFGNIPTHGLARYVCILQGFIGWFLLSIFTVALINQAQF
ncbi:MAG: two pore domain potassium channel family protein [Saprospiraceae bacterium]|nr:two pore domain potassium channel family protein [Saprospiraceae bacterium]